MERRNRNKANDLLLIMIKISILTLHKLQNELLSLKTTVKRSNFSLNPTETVVLFAISQV